MRRDRDSCIPLAFDYTKPLSMETQTDERR